MGATGRGARVEAVGQSAWAALIYFGFDGGVDEGCMWPGAHLTAAVAGWDQGQWIGPDGDQDPTVYRVRWLPPAESASAALRELVMDLAQIGTRTRHRRGASLPTGLA
jgi:hypothetical protein